MLRCTKHCSRTNVVAAMKRNESLSEAFSRPKRFGMFKIHDGEESAKRIKHHHKIN
jgi:hypothetical protein